MINFQHVRIRIYQLCFCACYAFALNLAPDHCSAVDTSTTAVEPVISDLSLQVSQNKLNVDFCLINAYDSEVEKIVKSGAPLQIVYEIKCKTDGFLWDHEISSKQLVRNLYFDVIKGHYQVGFGFSTPRIINVKDFSEAAPLLFNITNTSLTSLDMLKDGRDYTVMVQATISRVSDIPLPFKPLVSIFSSWGITTDWNEISFRYKRTGIITKTP